MRAPLSRRDRWLLLLFVPACSATLGCGARTSLSDGDDDGAATFDAGARDAGAPDASTLDGSPRDGASPFDAGPLPDRACRPEEGGPVSAFHRALAPDGRPIGGGPGYDAIVEPAGATVVRSAEALVAALATAPSGATVYVDDAATLDLSAHAPLVIGAGVTLASGRGPDGSLGALLFARGAPGASDALLVTGGPRVRVTGLRLRGPEPHRGDHSVPPLSPVTAVHQRHPDLEVDNCEIWAFRDHALRLEIADGARIHHDDLHHLRGVSTGHGVLVESAAEGVVVEANRVDHVRHPIVAWSPDASVRVNNNVVLDHVGSHRVELLDDASGAAGAGAEVRRNFFRGSVELDLDAEGTPSRILAYTDNWTGQDDLDDAVRVHTATAAALLEARGNVFGDRAVSWLPLAAGRATPSEAIAPAEVRFSGLESREPGDRDCRMREYRWHFGDGRTGEVDARGPAVSHRFEEPGRYLVTLRIDNALGVPQRTHVPVLIRPSAPGRWLSLWVRDTYRGDRAGYYAVQVLVDGALVAERDVAETDDTWQHVVLDVTDAVGDERLIEVAVRLTALRGVEDRATEINDVIVFVDDLHLFGGRVVNGDFEEGPNGWRIDEVGSTLYLGGSTGGASRSGDRSLVLGVSYVDPASGPAGPATGSFVAASQRFLRDD